jgi:hypothetical protein
MGSLVGGLALIALALFMLLGFVSSDAERAAGTTIIALLLTVALPAGAGIYLLRGRSRGGARLAERREVLRRQTLASELVRLAAAHDGKLTSIEVVRELAVPVEEAEEALRDLALRGVAEPEVTDSGLLVYAFHDLRKLDEKSGSKGVLE